MKTRQFILLCSALLVLSSMKTIYQSKSSERKEVSEYNILLSIERGNTEESVRSFIENDSLFADILSRKYLEPVERIGDLDVPRYYDLFLVKRLHLSASQIDSLNKFTEMVENNKIRHNQGLKIAGRFGQYKILKDQIKLEAESRNLYSLITALNIENEEKR